MAKLPDLKKLPAAVRFVIFLAALYVFLMSIELLGIGFRDLGGGFAQTLFTLVASPLTGLFIGMLATSIWQCSAATISVAVGLVACGSLTIDQAIPIVMGANIGTTVTSTIVSFVHITRKQEFERAFPAAMIHDIFNILTVLVLLPVELAFHPLRQCSGALARAFQGIGGLSVASPLQLITAPPLKAICALARGLALVELAAALVLLFGALTLMVSMLRSLVSRRFEVLLDKYLFGHAGLAFLFGIIFTVCVQSSSVTVSLAIPLAGAGLLTLEQLFPYALGANIGTTLTALLAALVTGSVTAVQLALTHALFNISGSAIWYPLRRVPIILARKLGRFCARHRAIAIVAVIIVFFVIPLVAVIMIRRS